MSEVPTPAQFPVPTEELISGARIQKLLPYPSWLAVPDSAPSLLRLTGKGLMPLSSLSCSRSVFWTEPRGWSISGWSVSPQPGSRRQLVLNEPVEPFTRRVPPSGTLVRIPQGDLQGSKPLRTRFEPDGSAGFHGRVFPVRPYSRVWLAVMR